MAMPIMQAMVRGGAGLFALSFAAAAAAAAAAEPVVLKLSFFTSDRSAIYECQIKPFVDAVQAGSQGSVRIDVYFSGAISPVLTDQPQLVADGIADLALAAPGLSPQGFPDSEVLELPGLYRDSAEASRVFVRLLEAGALKDFADFKVAAALVSAAENIDSRKPTATLADLRGQKIRVNNRIEAATLTKFGAVPVLLAINQTMSALAQEAIDGATVSPSMVFEFGFARLASNHYLIPLSGAPVALLINRTKFAALPPAAQDAIRKYGGEWLSQRAAACFERKNRVLIEQLEADPLRKVVRPSAADMATAEDVFASVIEEWSAQSARNRELLELVKVELVKLRGPN